MVSPQLSSTTTRIKACKYHDRHSRISRCVQEIIHLKKELGAVRSNPGNASVDLNVNFSMRIRVCNKVVLKKKKKLLLDKIFLMTDFHGGDCQF